MMPSIMSGSLIRETPPWARMSAGTRSSAITATAPASSAILACSAVTTSMITPPLSISAMPRLTRAVPVPVRRCSVLGSSRSTFYVAGRARSAHPRVVDASSLRPAAPRPPAGSGRASAGRGHVVEVDGAQLGGPSREAQPAHPAPRAQRPRGDHDVVVEPPGQLDPARSPRRARRPAARRRASARAPRARRRVRRTPPAAPADSAGLGGLERPRRRRCGRGGRRRAAAAGSAGSSAAGGGQLERDARRGAAAGRRGSPRATSMRWCIRSSRFAVHVSHRHRAAPPGRATSAAPHPGPVIDRHRPADDRLVDPQDLRRPPSTSRSAVRRPGPPRRSAARRAGSSSSAASRGAPGVGVAGREEHAEPAAVEHPPERRRGRWRAPVAPAAIASTRTMPKLSPPVFGAT